MVAALQAIVTVPRRPAAVELIDLLVPSLVVPDGAEQLLPPCDQLMV